MTDTRFFTNPHFVRPSPLQLKRSDSFQSLLHDDRSCFLLCHQERNVVLEVIEECLQESNIKIDSVQSERYSKYETTNNIFKKTAEVTPDLIGTSVDKSSVPTFALNITSQQENDDSKWLSSLRLSGKELKELLDSFQIVISGGKVQGNRNSIQLNNESKVPLLIILGYSLTEDMHYYVCDISNISESEIIKKLPSRVALVDLRSTVSRIQFKSSATELSIAQALCRWHRESIYCCRCGGKTYISNHGTCRQCCSCNHIEFPRQDPAILALIICGPYCLLGRKFAWQRGRFGCIAGFTEIGESVEETVVREAMEEANVIVDPKSIQYKGSQPWLFPRSLMFGYHAQCYNYINPITVNTSETSEKISNTTISLDQVSDEMSSGMSDSFSKLLPSHLHPSVPLATRGGFQIPSTDICLPHIQPDNDEMEDVRWIHIEFLKYWMLTSDPEQPKLEKKEELAIPIHFFHLPSKFSLSRELVDIWMDTYKPILPNIPS